MKRALLLPSLLILPLLAGCVQPRPEPVLNLSTLACDPEIRTEKALVPTIVNKMDGSEFDFFERLSLPRLLTVDVRPEIACVDVDGQKATYAVIALPDAPAPYKVTVRSVAIEGRLWAPTARVFDEARQVTREFAFDRFFPFEGSYEIEVYPRGGERYLVLKSDLSQIARLNTQEATLTRTETVSSIRFREVCHGKGRKRRCHDESYTDYDYISVPYRGLVKYQYAHDGRITAAIRYVEPKNIPPDQL